MNILKRHKTNIPKKYVYIAALLFSLAVIIQVSGVEQNPSIALFIRRFILFGNVYVLWALLLDYINALVKPFDKDTPFFAQIITRFLSIVLLVLFNLIVTNIVYYSILITITNFPLSMVYSDFQPYIFKSFIIRLVDIIVIGIILKFIDANQTLQKQNLKVVSLENQLHISQLETLRNQLDPHFLFNTLHTLNTLIGYDDKKAKSMVIKVTNLLRKILDKREKQLINFDEEIDYFKNLLEIEQERFHDRLEVTIDIDDRTRAIMVPTLMLQPLIENAFKHGISQLEGKGEITLSANIKNDTFIISLTNSIPENKHLSSVNSTKVGLENLRKRLQQVFGAAYELTFNNLGSDFVVTIKINLK